MKVGDLVRCSNVCNEPVNVWRECKVPANSAGKLRAGDIMIVLGEIACPYGTKDYFFVLTRVGVGYIYSAFVESVIVPDACVESLRSA